MARNRMIKPDFWSDEKLMNISRDARLLFIALWNFADDYGVLHNSCRKILGDVFPFDNSVSESMVEGWLYELISQNLIVEHMNFLFVKNWGKHQKVAHPSKPIFSDDLDYIHEILMRPSGEPQPQRERERERERCIESNNNDYQKYLKQWNEFATKNNLQSILKLSDNRITKLKTRLQENEFVFDELLRKIESCKWLQGFNDRKWKVDFDWIIKNNSNYTKIIEGKYDHLKTTCGDYPIEDIHGHYRIINVNGKQKKQYQDGTVR